jgi:hypothetical protein
MISVKTGIIILVLVGIALSGVVLIVFFRPRVPTLEEQLEAHKPRLEENERALAEIGNVELDPANITFGQLKAIMRKPPNISHPVERATEASWYDGAVRASFFGTFEQVPDAARPYEIGISRPFKGSIRGVYLGDSAERIVTIGRQYGNEPEHNLSRFANSIRLNRPWVAVWTQDDNGKVTSLSLYDSTYIEIPRR